MGREKFDDIWAAWCRIKEVDYCCREIYVYRSVGYDKSHILAVLVCLLIRSGEHIVYLPDCHVMLAAPLYYVKRAFRLSFRAPSYSCNLERVLACKSFNDLIRISESFNNLCFIIDQANASDTEPETMDNVSNAAKDKL